MNKKTAVGLVLLAVLVMPVASANPVVYFKPTESTVLGGCPGIPNATTVEVWINTSQCAPSTGVASVALGVSYDPNCINVTDVTSTAGWSVWKWTDPTCAGSVIWLSAVSFMADLTGDFQAFSLTVNCTNCSCAYCKTLLNFSDGENPGACPLWITNLSGKQLFPVLVNGTFACGSVVAKDFSKPLYKGWNLISLPLVPEDNSASAVLSTVSYDAVYRYNATSKQFESADAMDPGTGYFVHATSESTWTYSGTPYTSVDVSLKQGLNMVGWLNCSKNVDDALSSIPGDCHYIARWNPTSEKFEVHNPAAPSTFNDFTAMDRGTGYFISAKQGCALSENC